MTELSHIVGGANTQKNMTTWSFEKDVPNQQVGNVWVNAHEIVSLSMGRELSVLDVRESNSKLHVLSRYDILFSVDHL